MKVQELLSDESKWLKGRAACDSAGHTVHYNSQEAVQWCVLGAFLRCYAMQPEERAIVGERLYESAKVLFGVEELMPWQDDPSTTFQMIKAVIAWANA